MTKENCVNCQVTQNHLRCYQQIIDTLEEDLENRKLSPNQAIIEEGAFFEARKTAANMGCHNATIEDTQFRLVVTNLWKTSIGASGN